MQHIQVGILQQQRTAQTGNFNKRYALYETGIQIPDVKEEKFLKLNSEYKKMQIYNDLAII